MVSNAKKCVLPGAAFMLISLALELWAVFTCDWLVLSCDNNQEVRLGLWEMCLKPDGACVSLPPSWEELPNWLPSVAILQALGAGGLAFLTLMVLLCLRLPDEATEDNAKGLAWGCVGSASFIFVGLMVCLSETSNLYQVFVSFEEFADAQCRNGTTNNGEKEDLKAKSARSVHLAWASIAVACVAGLILLVAGLITPSRQKGRMMPSRKRNWTHDKYGGSLEHSDDGQESSYVFANPQTETGQKSRWGRTRMIDAYMVNQHDTPHHSSHRPED